jgi:hypothetical protein
MGVRFPHCGPAVAAPDLRWLPFLRRLERVLRHGERASFPSVAPETQIPVHGIRHRVRQKSEGPRALFKGPSRRNLIGVCPVREAQHTEISGRDYGSQRRQPEQVVEGELGEFHGLASVRGWMRDTAAIVSTTAPNAVPAHDHQPGSHMDPLNKKIPAKPSPQAEPNARGEAGEFHG